jgi:hypothetical protein
MNDDNLIPLVALGEKDITTGKMPRRRAAREIRRLCGAEGNQEAPRCQTGGIITQYGRHFRTVGYRNRQLLIPCAPSVDRTDGRAVVLIS